MVAEVTKVFWEHWEHARQEEALYAENTNPFVVNTNSLSTGAHLAQLELTMPRSWGEASILESFLNAIQMERI